MLLNLYYLAGLNIIHFSIHQLIVRDVPPDLKSDGDALTIALPKDKCGPFCYLSIFFIISD